MHIETSMALTVVGVASVMLAAASIERLVSAWIELQQTFRGLLDE